MRDLMHIWSWEIIRRMWRNLGSNRGRGFYRIDGSHKYLGLGGKTNSKIDKLEIPNYIRIVKPCRIQDNEKALKESRKNDKECLLQWQLGFQQQQWNQRDCGIISSNHIEEVTINLELHNQRNFFQERRKNKDIFRQTKIES